MAASATDLSTDAIGDALFDAVLIMGPLYHLLSEAERQFAVKNAYARTRPGGYVFASFLSPYPVLPRVLNPENEDLLLSGVTDEFLATGIVGSPRLSNLIEHYRCWPAQARYLMEECGYHTVQIRNLEGVGTFFEREQVAALRSKETVQAWFEVLRGTCDNPDLLGATVHFLYVGQKPINTDDAQ